MGHNLHHFSHSSFETYFASSGCMKYKLRYLTFCVATGSFSLYASTNAAMGR
jgi:hypothetical protein